MEWETALFSRRLPGGELSTQPQPSTVVCLVSSETFQGLTRIITMVNTCLSCARHFLFLEISSPSLSSSFEWTLLFSSLDHVEADAEKQMSRSAAKRDVGV